MTIQKSSDGFGKATITLSHPSCCGECPLHLWDGEYDYDYCVLMMNSEVRWDTIVPNCPLGWKLS